MRTPGIFHGERDGFQTIDSVAGNNGGTLREFIRHDLEVHPTGLDASMFHFYNRARLGEVPPAEESKLFH